jgi:hypothetical protein
VSDWQHEEVLNEVRSRRTNEWIEATNDSFGGAHAMDRYLCECSDIACTSTVSLTRAEYEIVRSDGLQFAITVDHENPELDRVREEHPRYTIVTKMPGDPARTAIATDPRRPAPA